MKKRRLGASELELTTVGLGTWAIGGSGWSYGWGLQDDEESINAVLRAFEKGINWIDTAAVYGLGHSEEVVGRAIKKLGEKPIVATKCGRFPHKDGSLYGNLKKDSVRSEVEASLKRLGLETIDLYQIHWPDPDKDLEEAWGAIAELIKEGKIRYGGVSNFNVEQLERIYRIHPVTSLQPPYSMLVRGVEDELLSYCARKNIGVIVYSPMQKGLLTGKFTREYLKDLAEDDHRRRDPNFREPRFSKYLELIRGLRQIAEKRGKTVGQLAIAWVLRRPEVTSAIVGARRPSQIEETAVAGDWELSKEDIEAVAKLLR